MSLLLKTGDLQRIALDLVESYGPGSDSADFFDHDALVIDASKIKGRITSEDLAGLIKALQTCRLKPVAFRSAVQDDQPLALALGLAIAPPDAARVKPLTESKKTNPTVVEVVREVIKETVREVPGPATMVVDKPVRSGQKIYARGADLVVLAMVNQGAEVVADGHIHVYAPLRGKAMAGASGNTAARIFSTCLEPELISIAGVYRTSENSLAPEIQGKAAQVRLSDDGQEKLLFEALNF